MTVPNDIILACNVAPPGRLGRVACMQSPCSKGHSFKGADCHSVSWGLLLACRGYEHFRRRRQLEVPWERPAGAGGSGPRVPRLQTVVTVVVVGFGVVVYIGSRQVVTRLAYTGVCFFLRWVG